MSFGRSGDSRGVVSVAGREVSVCGDDSVELFSTTAVEVGSSGSEGWPFCWVGGVVGVGVPECFA